MQYMILKPDVFLRKYHKWVSRDFSFFCCNPFVINALRKQGFLKKNLGLEFGNLTFGTLYYFTDMFLTDKKIKSRTVSFDGRLFSVKSYLKY